MGLSLEDLRERFGEEVKDARPYLDNHDGVLTLEIPRQILLDLMNWAREEAEPNFPQLCVLTATDESLPADSSPDVLALRRFAPKRFRMLYQLSSGQRCQGERAMLRIVVWVDEGEAMPSLTGIWPGSAWMEREVFDMFGILFDEHPDLKRILMPDGYDGHPLRKDFPLRGKSPERLYREWDFNKG